MSTERSSRSRHSPPTLVRDTPRFVWIKPGLCNDGHDCSLDVAGAWLENTVSQIRSSSAWRPSSVMFVLGRNETRATATSFRSSWSRLIATRGRSATRYDHYSLLATIQDLFGLPRLGAAATAQPLTQLIAGR